MKKLIALMFSLALCTCIAQQSFAENSYGLLYKNAVEAGSGSSNIAPVKKGTATCTSYFALVSLGECGIKDAMKNGKIRNLAFYDYSTRNILGYKKVTVNAYGQ